MNVFLSLLAVVVLAALAWIGSGVEGLQYGFGVIIPYAAIALFLVGFLMKIFSWAKAPVPFRIPTTCGQHKSHDWIRSSTLDNPHTGWGVLRRMFLEIFFFRSLFRNTRMELREGPHVAYASAKWLWAFGLAFHYCFLAVIIRHFKFFVQPVPEFVHLAESLDGFMQIGLPILFMSDIILVAALTYLFLRRIFDPKIRYISLAADYFPLFLLLGIALSGVWMRYFGKTDIVAIKQLAIGLVSFSPTIPDGIGGIFFMHFFLVCVLIAYFPYSKLMHMAGVFFSPTRNLASNNRMKRHINPWNPEVEFHTYAEYEDEFRDVMRAAELPLDKEGKE